MSAIVTLSPLKRNEDGGAEYAVRVDGREIGTVGRVRVSHSWGRKRILTHFSAVWKWKSDATGRREYTSRAKAIVGMMEYLDAESAMLNEDAKQDGGAR